MSELLSKDAIIDKYSERYYDIVWDGFDCLTVEDALKAMSEFAKQEAIGFHRWAHENHYSKYWGSDGPNNNKWYKGFTSSDREYYTDEDLYNLYIQSKLK